MLIAIAAVGDNNVIGRENKLIWNLPRDLKRFKEITTGHSIIMGRKTFESIGKPLPNRKNIILTRNKDFKCDHPEVEIIYDLEKIKIYINSKEEYFIIGGAQIYKELMPYTSKIYLTRIYHDFSGDVYFPKINEKLWLIEKRELGIKDEENPYHYEYLDYIRIK